MRHSIVIDILGCRFGISFGDKRSRDVLTACYAPFVRAGGSEDETAYQYKIDRSQHGWHLLGADLDLYCPKLSDLIYDFEKDLTIRVQLTRTDLLFVHAAAVCAGNDAIVIAGESGAGKSTLCWALCHEGFAYMSDELAPIDTSNLGVHAWPRALCLKSRPDDRYPLPAEAIDAGSTLHIPPTGNLGGQNPDPAALAAIVFIDSKPPAPDEVPVLDISPGECAARLYANALNQLSHENHGLAAVNRIASQVPSYRVRRRNLHDMAVNFLSLLK